jgi:dTDP-4-amino-4,6-dideoxygalactose transaminase
MSRSSNWIPAAHPYLTVEQSRREIDAAVARVIDSGNWILGEEVERLEDEFAEYLGVDHSVGVGNATDGISLALRALGFGPGDEVISVSHTAVATIAGIEMAGCMPVLVDVEETYFTIDSHRLAQALSPRTVAVVAVHLYGQACDLDGVLEFCRRHGLALIEDASQAHGATLDGRILGSVGDVGVFSCYPTKNLGGIGDAGLVTTRDEGLNSRIRSLRNYGWQRRNFSESVGVNSRLDEIQAAVLRIQLARLGERNEERRRIAQRYSRSLSTTNIQAPALRSGAEHVFHQFVVQTDDRDGLRGHLERRGIGTAIHYPTPVHAQPAYQDRVRCAEPLSVTERMADRILSLPIYPGLMEDQISRVESALVSWRQ